MIYLAAVYVLLHAVFVFTRLQELKAFNNMISMQAEGVKNNKEWYNFQKNLKGKSLTKEAAKILLESEEDLLYLAKQIVTLEMKQHLESTKKRINKTNEEQAQSSFYE